ncbi:efflux RND transporter periplasmic adaptor subunit [Pseudothermotoga sp. U03pept]|uniref:efflux RND transporter periplasmic adaptor subunit n=1 Tax=Pseudothermotoga sp. U03pept TaxID=3447012 RepID=UPI003EFE1A09
MRKYILFAMIIMSIMLLFWSCNRSAQQSVTTNSSTIEYTVKKTNLTDTVSVSGKIMAESSAEIKALVSGVVKKINVQEGDTVKAGDVLVELDDSDYRLSYLKALQNYETAKNSGSRLLVEQRQLELEIAKRDLDRCKITSPVDGVVTALNVKVGDYVSKGTSVDVVAKVISLDNLYVSAAVEEVDYSKVKVGQMATLAFDAFEGVNFPAQVTYVGSEAQSSSGIVTIPIKLKLVVQNLQMTTARTSSGTQGTSEDAQSMAQGFVGQSAAQRNELLKKIIPGLSCEVQIIVLAKNDVMIIPTAAVSFEGGKAYVNVKSGTTTEKREVTVGERTSGGYEIISGLNEGEVVVVNKTSSSSTNRGVQMNIPGFAPPR